MARGRPKRDGSGGGRRLNMGRGGCEKVREIGQGMSDRVRRLFRRD
jgi:hypothetical protein